VSEKEIWTSVEIRGGPAEEKGEVVIEERIAKSQASGREKSGCLRGRSLRQSKKKTFKVGLIHPWLVSAR